MKTKQNITIIAKQHLQTYFIKISLLLILLMPTGLIGQNLTQEPKAELIEEVLDSLWVNPTSFFNKEDSNWNLLCETLQLIDSTKMTLITHSIYTDSLRERKNKIENESNAFDGLAGFLNKRSNKRKFRKYSRKKNSEFMDKNLNPDNKTVMIEGDSWFEYPLFLKDVTDQLEKKPNMAIYSMAAGGDWIANMISGLEYKTEYKKIKPDVFILSGGGNDMLQDNGLKRFVRNKPIDVNDPFLEDYKTYLVLRMSNRPVPLCKANFCPPEYHAYENSLNTLISKLDTTVIDKIVNGRRYINKDFYKFLVSLKLEYKILFETLHKINPSHFDSLKIITQGYDYAIPNSSKKFGFRLLLPNGIWLNDPLDSLGITGQKNKESIVMAMMFDFNEMLIELGKEYPNIYHVDVRGFIDYMQNSDNKKSGKYWFDELHPTNYIFQQIAEVYYSIIENKVEPHKRVFNMIDYFEQKKTQASLSGFNSQTTIL